MKKSFITSVPGVSLGNWAQHDMMILAIKLSLSTNTLFMVIKHKVLDNLCYIRYQN